MYDATLTRLVLTQHSPFAGFTMTGVPASAVVQRGLAPAMQFGALDGMNEELKKAAAPDDDEVPMTKAEMREEAKQAAAEMKALKAEAAAAEKAAKDAAA